MARKQIVLRPTDEQHAQLKVLSQSEEPTLSFNAWAVRKLLVPDIKKNVTADDIRGKAPSANPPLPTPIPVA